MAKLNKAEIGLLVLASVGAGTLIGALAGLILGRRAARRTSEVLTGSVEELKERAEQALDELSNNVTELVGRSQHMISDSRPAQ